MQLIANRFQKRCCGLACLLTPTNSSSTNPNGGLKLPCMVRVHKAPYICCHGTPMYSSDSCVCVFTTKVLSLSPNSIFPHFHITTRCRGDWGGSRGSQLRQAYFSTAPKINSQVGETACPHTMAPNLCQHRVSLAHIQLLSEALNLRYHTTRMMIHSRSPMTFPSTNYTWEQITTINTLIANLIPRNACFPAKSQNFLLQTFSAIQ